jgi:hypothetical protein
VRLAGVVREDALAEIREQLVEGSPVLGRRPADQTLGFDARERLLDRLVAEGCDVIGDEISDAAAQSAHRLAVQVERGRWKTGCPAHERVGWSGRLVRSAAVNEISCQPEVEND